VYVRLKGGEDRDQEEGVIAGGWYPVGSMSCPSSQVINPQPSTFKNLVASQLRDE
jgi:hypothetical protein